MYVAKRVSAHEVAIIDTAQPKERRWLLSDTTLMYIGGMTTTQVGRLGLIVATVVAVMLLTYGTTMALSAVVVGLGVYGYSKYVRANRSKPYRRRIFYTDSDEMRSDIAALNGRHLHQEVASQVKDELDRRFDKPELEFLRRVADEQPDNEVFSDAYGYADDDLRELITECRAVIPLLDARENRIAARMRRQARNFARSRRTAEHNYEMAVFFAEGDQEAIAQHTKDFELSYAEVCDELRDELEESLRLAHEALYGSEQP